MTWAGRALKDGAQAPPAGAFFGHSSPEEDEDEEMSEDETADSLKLFAEQFNRNRNTN